MKYLLRYGEIGLKSSHVRRTMKTKLMANLGRLFKREGGRCSLMEEEGRLFLKSEHPETRDILARAFGLVSYSPVLEAPSALPDMTSLAVDVAKQQLHRGTRFAVRVRRVGDHPYSSVDVAREIGTAVLSIAPGLKVDLGNPDWEVMLEIRGGRAYLYSEVIRGPGGLPMGTQGRVVAYVEGWDGILAAWLMMRRGCWVTPVYVREERWARALEHWDPDLSCQQVESLNEMTRVADSGKAMGYVYPWGVEKARGEDLRPSYYPLSGLSDDSLEDLRRRVLTPLGL